MDVRGTKAEIQLVEENFPRSTTGCFLRLARMAGSDLRHNSIHSTMATERPLVLV